VDIGADDLARTQGVDDGVLPTHIWNARSAETVDVYASPWTGALAIAEGLGWTRTASWRGAGRYDTTRPSARVRAALAQHRMRPGDWRELLGLPQERLGR
jgi:hypothetical protein